MRALNYQERHDQADDRNIVALIKSGQRREQYLLVFDNSQRAEALRQLGRWASNPELSFTWYDAACVSQRIRRTSEERRGRRSA